MRLEQAVCAAAVAVLASAGCRDLSYSPNSDNAGPSLDIVQPGDGATLPLRWLVELEANDPDGLAHAAVTCRSGTWGPVPLLSWTRPPYSGEADFAPCIPPTHPAGTAAEIVLEVVVHDALDASTSTTRGVRVDPVIPSLAVAVPARVAPGSTVQLTMTSDAVLAALPSVLLDGAPVSVSGDVAAKTFQASFTAPPLGTDTAPGQASTTLAVLEDVERPVELRFEARGDNGNVVRFSRTVRVSRVLWERSVPGDLLEEGEDKTVTIDQRPFATADGVWLPFNSEGLPGDPPWVPAFLEDEDGTMRALDPGQPFRSRGFALDGTALVEFGAVTHRYSPQNESLGSGTLPPGVLVRFADWTCAISVSTDSTCMNPPLASVGCMGNGPTSFPPFAFGTSVVQGSTWNTAVSGATAVGFGWEDRPFCASPNNRALMQVTTAGVTPTTLASEVARLVPLGSTGDFAASLGADPGATVAQIRNGSIVATYAVPTATAGSLVAGRDDGSVATVRYSGGTTQIQGFTPVAPTGPAISLPGRYEYVADPAAPRAAHNIVVLADGSVAYLARTHDFGRAVVALNPDLTARWIYRYPRGTQRAVLVGRAGTAMYFVDLQNDYVVALSPEW